MVSLAAAGSMFDEGSARTGTARSVDLAQLVKACALNEPHPHRPHHGIPEAPGGISQDVHKNLVAVTVY